MVANHLIVRHIAVDHVGIKKYLIVSIIINNIFFNVCNDIMSINNMHSDSKCFDNQNRM